jgi:hypothetical protein
MIAVTRYFHQGLLVTLLILLGLIGSSCDKQQKAEPFVPEGIFDVNVVLSTNIITVGELVDATIEVYHPPAGLATVPEIDRRPDIVVRKRSSSSEAFSEDLAVTRIAYQLTSYRVGLHALSTNKRKFVLCEISTSQSPPFPG